MVAIPHLTVTITAPGGAPTDYTANLAWANANQQARITQNFGRQGDTALLPLVEDFTGTTPTLAIPAMSQISVYDTLAATTVFSGVVNSPVQCVRAVRVNEWDLSCVDYTTYADNAIVYGIFYGWSADQIIIALTQQADCGITAASVEDGGFVAPGPQLSSYVLNYGTLSTAWRQLATLASSVSPYGWFVDENLELHWFDSSTAAPSGVTFTTGPTTSGSTTEGHILLDSQNAYDQDGASLANRVLVQGARQDIRAGAPRYSAPTDAWQGDGVQTAWPLRFFVSGVPTLFVDGVRQTVVLALSGTTASGPWVVEQNAIGAYFLVADQAPAYGTSIQTWYTYRVPVVTQSSDAASIAQYAGPNGGVFEKYINDSALTTVPMALARAQRERTEYAFVVERFTFDSSPDFLGWVRAGWTCTILDPAGLLYDPRSGSFGVNGSFILVANTITFEEGGYRSMEVTAVRI